MAYTRIGFSGDWPAFGVKSGGFSWGYINTKSVEHASEKAELPDEDGDIVGLAYHGFKKNISFEGVVKATGAPGDVAGGGVAPNGGSISWTDQHAVTYVAYSDAVTFSESNSDWVKISGTATSYPSVATTTTTTTT